MEKSAAETAASRRLQVFIGFASIKEKKRLFFNPFAHCFSFRKEV